MVIILIVLLAVIAAIAGRRLRYLTHPIIDLREKRND